MGDQRVTSLVIAFLLAIPLGLSAIPAVSATYTAPETHPSEDPVPERVASETKRIEPGEVGALAGCSEGDPTVTLSDGVAQSFSLTAVSGSQCNFAFTPIPGQTHNKVVLAWSSGSHDYDLYVRKGAAPTTSVYDCRPFISGSNETCQLANDNQLVYVMVNWFSGSGSATVTATSLTPPPTCVHGVGTSALSSGVPVNETVTLDLGARCEYSFTFPAGTNLARVNLTPSNSSNNVNLYTRYALAPTSASPPASSDCSSTLSGVSVDTCSLTSNATTVFITVYRPTAGTFDATFTLRVDAISSCSLGADPVALTNGVSQLGSLTWDLRANCMFSFTPGSPADFGRVNLSPVTDNFDLRLKLNAIPSFATTTVAGVSCSSSLSGLTVDSCGLTVGPTDTLYALVFRTVAGTTTRDFNVRGDALQGCAAGSSAQPLSSGVNGTGTLGNFAGAKCLFSWSPGSFDAGTFNLTPATTDNVDIYVRKNAAPDPAALVYDCRSILSGITTDSCVLSGLLSTDTVYVTAYRPTSVGAAGNFNVRIDGSSTCSLGAGTTSLLDNVAQAGSLANLAGAGCRFSFLPGPNTDIVSVTMNIGAGQDFDLYLRKGSPPTTSLYDCRPFSGTAVNETCTAANDGTSTYYAWVTRFSGSGAFSITAKATSTCSLPGTTEILNNVAQLASLTNDTGATCRFVFNPAIEEDSVSVVMTPPASADFDTYVKKGSPPTTTSFDCSQAAGVGIAETCTFANDGSPVYSMIRRFSGSGEFAITARAFSPCSFGNGNQALADGVSATASLSVDAGAVCYFKFTPPAGVDLAKITMTPDTGDFDLYAKIGSRPSVGSFGCSSANVGDAVAEACSVSGNAGDVYVMVAAVTGSGSFTVTATGVSTCSNGIADSVLADGIASTASLTDDAGAACFYKFTVPAGVDLAKILVTPASGDFDLYAKFGSRPTTSSFGCASTIVGAAAAESCTLVPSTGDLYVMVRRASGSGSFSITASGVNTCSLGQGDHVLSEGVDLTASLTSDVGAVCFFKFTAGSGFDAVKATLSSASDFDLYAKIGSRPTTSSFTCSSVTAGIESCTAGNTGSLYVMVRRASGSGSFTIRGDSASTCSLGMGPNAIGDGVNLTAALLNIANAKCVFEFAPAAGADFEHIILPATNPNDFDLYVKKGSVPTTTSFDCRPYLGGTSDEVCDGAITDATHFFIMVTRFSGSGNFTLRAESISSCTLGGGIHTLADGVPTNGGLLAIAGAKCYFEFAPDAAADFVHVELAATSPADFDVYVKKGALPTTSSYDCAPLYGGASTETCDSLLTDAGHYFVMVRRYSGSGPFNLSAASVVVPELQNAMPAVSNVAGGALQYWKVVVPEGSSLLAIAILGDPTGLVCAALDANGAAGTCADTDATICARNVITNTVCHNAQNNVTSVCAQTNTSDCPSQVSVDAPDADLYVRYAAGLPTPFANDCSSESAGSIEACAFSNDLVGAEASAADNFTSAMGQIGAACPDPATCGPDQLPGWPGLPVGVSLVPFQGAGKYFIGVRGASAADYAIVAAFI